MDGKPKMIFCRKEGIIFLSTKITNSRQMFIKKTRIARRGRTNVAGNVLPCKGMTFKFVWKRKVGNFDNTIEKKKTFS